MRDILSFDRADHRLSAYLEFFILNSISSFSQSQRDTCLLSAHKFAILFVSLFVCLCTDISVVFVTIDQSKTNAGFKTECRHSTT